MKYLRVVFRFSRIMVLLVLAASDFFFRIKLRGKSSSYLERTLWLQYWSKQWLKIMNVKVTTRGTPPARGILVSNHLSYMDVLVYGAVHPLVFVSKSEVKSWPVVGPYTQCAGTLYIRRQTKADVVRLGQDMVPVVNAGLVVTLFLEGTSTNGESVLPFRSSLLASAEEHDWPVTASWIHYSMRSGSVRDEVHYWGDMTFFPHIMNLFSKPGFEAFVSFDEPLPPKLNRKEMALQLHERVCYLREEYMRNKT
jgi:1-acyl-sn-glycerol-3-phosphate acyltransferase